PWRSPACSSATARSGRPPVSWTWRRPSWPSTACPHPRRWSARTSFPPEPVPGPRGENRMAKITVDSSLWERATRAAEAAGYSSVEEFVVHCVEKEIKRLQTDEAESHVTDQLRGLGYIE